MFLAVCYREFGPEALEAYQVVAESNNPEPALKRMLSQLKEGDISAVSTKKPAFNAAAKEIWYSRENYLQFVQEYTMTQTMNYK